MFNPDMKSDDDRDLVYCRHSTLERFRESPALFKAYHLDKTIPAQEPSAAMRLGSAVDSLLLTPEASRIVVIDGKLSRSTGKASMAKKDAIKAAAVADNKVWLTESEHDKAQRMVDAARADPEVKELLQDRHDAQKRVFWQCPWKTGFAKRGTLDYLSRDFLIDLKTTGAWNLHPKRFAYHVYEMGNHRQLAMYQEGLVANGMGEKQCKLLYISSEAPHTVALVSLGDQELSLGWSENRKTCNELADAFAFSDWGVIQEKKIYFPQRVFGVDNA